VQQQGWDWIGRVRAGILVKPHAAENAADHQWTPCTGLYRQARDGAGDLGVWDVVRRQPIVCRLVLHRKASRGRVDVTLTGQRARNRYSRKIAQRESEPWLLAVSPELPLTPSQIAAIYGRRMQIEQSFRDLKSHRYGVGFEDSLTRTSTRLATLLLILALASFVAWMSARTATRDVLLAAAATLVGSTRTGVLSWHRIGWRLLRDRRWRIDVRLRTDTILLDGDALASG
jgi:hypothetical protein